jgi:hypothetical protein
LPVAAARDGTIDAADGYDDRSNSERPANDSRFAELGG